MFYHPRFFLSYLSALTGLLLLIGCGAATTSPDLQSGAIALLSISDAPFYSFGNVDVGTVASKVFTVENVGDYRATEMQGSIYLSAFGFQGGAYPGAGGNCSDELLPHESCTIAVTFAPYIAEYFETTLGLFYFNGASYQTTASPSIRGQGFLPTP